MISAELSIIRSLIRPIIEKPFDGGRKWQVQGLGMLRTYINKDTRLHLWDSRLNYCEDSGWHSHPWDFASFIAWGKIINRRYLLARADRKLEPQHIGPDKWVPFVEQHIICGPGGCAISEPEPVHLWAAVHETMYAGDHYQQRADEIHSTEAENGTVSIITRNTVHQDGSANVYYPRGSTWSSAEARDASFEEITMGTKLALEKMETAI